MIIDRIKKRLVSSPQDSLEKKVVKGGAWVFLIRVGQRFLGLVRNIILARILAPTDFGLFGIALLTFSILESFTESGFSQALIQKKDRPKKYLDTAWTIQVLRGLVLTGLLFLISPLVAGFFHESMAEPIIKILSINILLSGFVNIGVIYFRKELRFDKVFIFTLAGPLVDLVVTIGAVLILRNVWALVIGSLAGAAINLLVSYLIHPYRPRFKLDWQKAKDLFGFGKWVFGATILTFLLTEGDDILVGRLLGAATLGLYQMAYRISNFPATQITQVINQVSFPAYAKIQDQMKKLRLAYLRVLKVAAFFSFPLAFLIAFFAFDFTKIFLGDKWLPAVLAMQGLALWGLIRSISATTGPIFKARGRPDIITKIQIAKLVILAGSIYPLTINYGLTGTVISVVGSALIINPFADYILIRFIKIRAWEFVSRLLFPALGVLVSWLLLVLIKAQWLPQASLFSFASLALIGLGGYLAIMLIFDWLGYYQINIRIFVNRFLKQ